MNSLNVAKDTALDRKAVPVGTVGRDGISWDAHWMGRRSERQSGLSYTWQDGAPRRAEPSTGRSVQLRLKRVFDLAVAGAALVALAPLFVLVAIAIKATSPGAVFFTQPREGLHGRVFHMFKFRSMHSDAGDRTGVAQTVKDDPRVTSIGRLLRRTSIDELPQLINVMKGDMSLVGPRPHVAGMRAGGTSYRQLVPYYDLRVEVLPGLTGWAQANGLRGSTDDARAARARIDHDIAYIQNFSLLLDLKILGLTVQKEFLGGSGV